MGDRRLSFDWSEIDAVLFDLDGVLTPTADLHERAWTDLFNGYLGRHAPDEPPFTDADYLAHVDGRARYDGVRTFLASRQIELPEGSPTDAPGDDTVHALGNAKNAAFQAVLRRDGITAFAGSLALLDALATATIGVAVVSSSRNAAEVLAAAGIADRFTVVIDGAVAAERSLPGKPAPDTYLAAAADLGVAAARAAVVEDALSGVAAGRAGAFGAVIGVDRGAGPDALRANGADIVVGDLAELLPVEHVALPKGPR